MKRPILLAILGLTAFLIAAPAEQFLLLAARNHNELLSYTIDPGTGKLSEHFRLRLDGTGGPMSLTPDGKFLYVESHKAREGEDRPSPHIASLRVDNGKFRLLHVAPVHLRSPSIHVDATGRNLLAAHYGPGKVSVWKIDETRRCTGELIDSHDTAPRAHFIVTDPGNRFAYVPHTSPNAVYQFSLDAAKGRLIPLDPPFVGGPDKDHHYHEPRHYAHHPTLPMGYTSNERGGGISAWAFNKATGELTLKQTLNTLPPGWDGSSAGADIHITPDGKFVYMSNRDTRKREGDQAHGDTLAGFRIDREGRLSPIGHFPTVHFPRAFCIDRTGNFVYVAGQRDNKLAAHRIDPASGRLTRIGTYPTGNNPIWVLTVEEGDR